MKSDKKCFLCNGELKPIDDEDHFLYISFECCGVIQDGKYKEEYYRRFPQTKKGLDK